MKRGTSRFFGLFAVFILIFALSGAILAQGRGKGGGNGKGNSGNVNQGNSNARGKSDDKIDRNISNGRADHAINKQNKGRGNDDFGNGRNNAGSNNRFNGLARKTRMSSEELQNFYESARVQNPNLTFGQFTAAHMIARHHSNVSAQTILGGLQNGRSIGQTLHDSGLNDKQIKEERKRIKKQARDDDDLDYKDKDEDWH